VPDKPWQRSTPKLAETLPETTLEVRDDLEVSDATIVGEVTTVDDDADSVEFAGCRFVRTRLTGLTLRRARFVDCVFDACELSGLTIEEARLNRVEFRDSRLLGLQAPDARGTDVAFVDCRIDAANFRMTTWERLELERCALVDADFLSAKLPNARLHACDLTRAQLAKADLRGASLRDSVVDDVQGADGLRRVTITSDQLVPLALAVFRGMSISIVDDEKR
jgi:uncharacterized protein YjbI with pentapeptide repeats